MKTTVLVFLVLVLVLLSRLAHTFIPSGLPSVGWVFEKETGRPVADVVVVRKSEGYVTALVDTQDVCVHADTAVTNALGFYWFSPWVKRSKAGPILGMGSMVLAYKDGYEQTSLGLWSLNHMRSSPEDAGRRLDYIRSMRNSTIGCADPDASGERLVPLYLALHKEAISIAKTKEDKKMAEGLLSWVELFKGSAISEIMKKEISRAEREMGCGRTDDSGTGDATGCRTLRIGDPRTSN